VPLTEREQAVLDLERSWWTSDGEKNVQVEAIGLAPGAYYQLLNELIDRPEALEYDPLVVGRPRRPRERRRHHRLPDHDEARAAEGSDR
jgi:Protein of unknown function (DUF3263)